MREAGATAPAAAPAAIEAGKLPDELRATAKAAPSHGAVRMWLATLDRTGPAANERE